MVPSSTSSRSPTHTSAFPVAAIAVICIIGGIAFLFVVYRAYRWYGNRRRDRDEALPEARSIAPPTITCAGSDEKGSFAGSRSASALGWSPSAATIGLGPGMTGYKGSEGWNTAPASRSGSDPAETPSAGSNNSHSSLPSHPGMVTAGSRSSMASYSSQPRRFHGPSALGQVVTRSTPSGPRFSGAPHNPRSRLEIVPPLPLAPPPGAVISTGKSTLDFAPDAGFGGGLSHEDAARRETDWQRASSNGSSSQQHHKQQQRGESQSSSNGPRSRHAEVRPINTKGLSHVEAGLGSPLDQLQHDMARQATQQRP